MADERGDRQRDEGASGTPSIPRGWQRHPQERMLITPLMAIAMIGKTKVNPLPKLQAAPALNVRSR